MVAMIRTINTSAHDLRGVEDGSVQAVITSPPYYGLRSYAGDQDVEWPTVTYRLNEWCEPLTVQGCEPGCSHEWVEQVTPPKHSDNGIDGSTLGGGKGTQAQAQRTPITSRYCQHCGGWRGPLGLEPSPVAYIGHLILCLREWRRVLRDDGVVFCNLGDSYAGSPRGNKNGWEGSSLHGIESATYQDTLNAGTARTMDKTNIGLKPKDLLGIPWMFAIAARADGWWLRSDIIWAKPNPMPESVTDRPTKSHEYIFLLTKSARYYWDQDAVREAQIKGANGSRFDTGKTMDAHGFSVGDREDNPAGRNIRTVWNISTAPYPGAHYAVFPERLVEPMVKAATSERGCCPSCGAPWRRVVERDAKPAGRSSNGVYTAEAYSSPQSIVWGSKKNLGGDPRDTTTIGWQPTCACDAGEPVPCVVLDPFAGSGTTARVATRLRRRSIICDISAEYLAEHVPARTTVQMELV